LFIVIENKSDERKDVLMFSWLVFSAYCSKTILPSRSKIFTFILSSVVSNFSVTLSVAD
jgi:hypothetical protein